MGVFKYESVALFISRGFKVWMYGAWKVSCFLMIMLESAWKCRSLQYKTEILWCEFDFAAFSALQLSDCKEFKVIDPEDYDKNVSSIYDITKRPLGYMFGTAKNPGVQTVNLKNPCAYLTNLTSRNVEVMVR